MSDCGDPEQDLAREREQRDEYFNCLCWVGHGGCGGCSDYPGIFHEPACGWEWNPDCPVHPPRHPMSGDVVQQIAEVLDAYFDETRRDGYIVDGVTGDEAAEQVAARLNLGVRLGANPYRWPRNGAGANWGRFWCR